MKKLLREPFLHFVLIGACIFLLYAVVDDRDMPDDGSIVITQERIDYLSGMFGKTWQRQPSEKELDALIDDYIKEEVFYREALRLGLDDDDLIIRRRMRQKMEFVAEDISSLTEPTPEDLQRYLEDNRDRFEVPPRISFRQVYLNPDNHVGTLEDDVRQLTRRLRQTTNPDLTTLGDRIMVQSTFKQVTPFEATRIFGQQFSDRLLTLPGDTWTGPVSSGYGYHIVIVDNLLPGRKPELSEVREEVERELLNERRLEMLDAFYQSLRSNYEVIIERAVEGSDE